MKKLLILIVISLLSGCDNVETAYHKERTLHEKAIEACFSLGGAPILTGNAKQLKDCKFPLDKTRNEKIDK
jgi:hypothetical protein